MTDEYLTVDEVAALLKLNPQTVRNTIDRGDLPCVRFGRRVRIRRAALEEFIDASARRSKPSDRRREFDAATRKVNMSLGRSGAEAAEALLELAAAASSLADELRT